MPTRIEHRDIDGAECKLCSRCTEWKQLEQYTKKTTGPADGLCDKCKTCWTEYRKERSQKDKDYRKVNRDKVNEWRRNERHRKRENPDAAFYQNRLKENIARRVRLLLGGQKSENTTALMGCSTTDLKTHLEATFKEGMAWENYGTHGWHIDHRIPCIAFDQEDDFERRACWNWRNLQAMWAEENLQKNDQYDPKEKEKYLESLV
jgi:hypothetical protein